jgi:hypothetical protein
MMPTAMPRMIVPALTPISRNCPAWAMTPGETDERHRAWYEQPERGEIEDHRASPSAQEGDRRLPA